MDTRLGPFKYSYEELMGTYWQEPTDFHDIMTYINAISKASGKTTDDVIRSILGDIRIREELNEFCQTHEIDKSKLQGKSGQDVVNEIKRIYANWLPF